MSALYDIKPFLVKNSGYGSLSLSEEALEKLVDGTTDVNPVVVSGTVEFEVELFSRYKLSDIHYYYSEDSTITMQYSQDGAVWESFSVSYEDDYASASWSPESFSSWPSRVRISHTPSEATANAYEIVVTGFDAGMVEADTVVLDTSEDSGVTAIRLYNHTEATNDIHCFVESATNNTYSSGVYISDSETGPFYAETGKGVSFPQDFSWSTGAFSGVVDSGTSLFLDLASGTGYYESPVIDVSGLGPFRVFWAAENTPYSYIDYSSSIDSGYTVGVRFSHTSPESPWVSGDCPINTDAVWGSLSGTLTYSPYSNFSIIPGPPGRPAYFQLKVVFNSDVIGHSAELTSLGFSEAVTLSGVEAEQSSLLYARSYFDSYVAGQGAGILSFINE